MTDATPPADPPPPGPSDVPGGAGVPGQPDHPGSAESPGPPDPPGPSARRLTAIALATLVVVLAVYYALPIYAHSRGAGLPIRILLFIVGLLALTWLFLRQASMVRRAAPFQVWAQWLFMGVCLAVVLFAITYYSLACSTHQMHGIRTKTDALYFTVTVLTTVGFGDIRAVGQAGRVIVTIQMGFDVLFIATAGSALRASGAARRSHVHRS